MGFSGYGWGHSIPSFSLRIAKEKDGNREKYPRGDYEIRYGAKWLILFMVCLVASCKLAIDPLGPDDAHTGSIGIDIKIENGRSSPLVLATSRSFYIDEVNLKVTQVDFPTPEVLDWIQRYSGFSSLDWTNVACVDANWTEEADGTYTEVRSYHDATWMSQEFEFTIEVLGEGDRVLSGPVSLSDAGFAIADLTSLTWASGAPAEGDYGQNSSTYDQMSITTHGSFTGPGDDMYVIEVTTEGQIDGSAEVTISSVLGDGNPSSAPVLSGVPIDLGAAGYGATIVFDGTPSQALFSGDRWVVRCTASTGSVAGPVPGTRATYSGLSRIYLSAADRESAEFSVPEGARNLRLVCSSMSEPYTIPLQEADVTSIGYGLVIRVSLSEPQNGSYYLPGETVTVTINLFDQAGHRLHVEGFLPTYNQYLEGTSNGILYFRASPEPCVPFFNVCSENDMQAEVAGPTHRIRENYGQVLHSTTVGQRHFPEMEIIVGGETFPPLWDTRIPNEFSFELPQDAEPGTYVTVVKAGRSFRGETIQRMEVVEFQVGTEERTSFIDGTGNCDACHIGYASLERLRHGTSNDKVCKLCHIGSGVLYSEVIHRSHFFPPSYPIPRNDCSWCHYTSASNERVCDAVCSACHGGIHEGECIATSNPYQRCGITCHDVPTVGHVTITTD